jgi:proteasome accessory factor C
MIANAQSQVERMLALVPYLQARDGISVDEVARDFKVKPAQIVKDLKVLWFCGLPDASTWTPWTVTGSSGSPTPTT